jgi:lauroyl/myristoyl acyltransferase
MNRELRKVLRDLGMLAMTTGLGATAAVTPRGIHKRILSEATRLDILLRRERRIRRDDLRESEEMRRAVVEHRRKFRELRLEEAFCQGYGIYRPGWPADVTVTGLDHVHAAHAQGRGVVMWQMTFLDLTPLFVTMADAGYPVSHLSTAFHRLESRQELSLRLISPALIRGETRNLRERVMIPRNKTPGYLKRMRSIVKDEHGTVSIRGDFTSGQREIDGAHLDHMVSFPTGAPSLAHICDAPLLTAAVVRRAPLEHEVIIDEPIGVSRDGTRREFVYDAVQEFARRLDERARECRDSRSIVPFIPALDPQLAKP